MPRGGCHSKWVGVVVMLKTGEVLGVLRGLGECKGREGRVGWKRIKRDEMMWKKL